MKRSVFILVPSPHPTGPVKGASALANALASLREVTLVYLKDGPGSDVRIDDRIKVVSLADTVGGWRGKLLAYRNLLKQSGGRDRVASISMCFSADWINRYCRDVAVNCASVRGNLLQNYRYDFGWRGIPLAVGHLLSLRSFDHVAAMTTAMARQIKSLTGIRSTVIGNFVDESALEPYRWNDENRDRLRIVFVGSLTTRKEPLLLVKALQSVCAVRSDVTLQIVGDGPMRSDLASSIKSMGLSDHVELHGQVANPYPLVARADLFVLPSRSEGVSRAVLEALFLGVPCVLRDADGNSELLTEPNAGTFFASDAELPAAIFEAVSSSAKRVPERHNLLPSGFRQSTAAQLYLNLLEA